MHSSAFDLALASIDHRNWRNAGSKQRVMLVVRLQTIGQPGVRAGSYAVLGRSIVAAATGMDSRWVHGILDELVADVVLERDPGAGRRGHAYRITEPITRWRVPWSVDPILVEHRAARLQEAAGEPEPGFAARHHAQLFDVGARHGAQQPGCNCAACRAANAHRSARHGAQQRLADALAPLSLETYVSLSPEIHEEVVKDLSEAIVRRTQCAGVWGSVLTDLRAVVAEFQGEPSRLVSIVNTQAKPGDHPRSVVELLRRAAVGDAMEPPASSWVPAEWTPAAVELGEADDAAASEFFANLRRAAAESVAEGERMCETAQVTVEAP